MILASKRPEGNINTLKVVLILPSFARPFQQHEFTITICLDKYHTLYFAYHLFAFQGIISFQSNV